MSLSFIHCQELEISNNFSKDFRKYLRKINSYKIQICHFERANLIPRGNFVSRVTPTSDLDRRTFDFETKYENSLGFERYGGARPSAVLIRGGHLCPTSTRDQPPQIHTPALPLRAPRYASPHDRQALPRTPSFCKIDHRKYSWRKIRVTSGFSLSLSHIS